MNTANTIDLPESVLVKRQKRKLGPKIYTENGRTYCITAELRFDDECGNGHNSFSITATIDEKDERGKLRDFMGGCCHDEIVKHFPEMAPFIKWHLTSADGPMHYIANTLYWLGYSGYCDGEPGDPPNLEYARNAAVWPDMPEYFLASETTRAGSARGSLSIQGKQTTDELNARLARLMAEFKTAMESLGFVY